MITSTPGRLPVISFSDDADYDTLTSVLATTMGDYIGYGWCVSLVLKDGTQREVALAFKDAPIDHIGGRTWNTSVDECQRDWNGPEVYVPIDDVVQIIVL